MSSEEIELEKSFASSNVGKSNKKLSTGGKILIGLSGKFELDFYRMESNRMNRSVWNLNIYIFRRCSDWTEFHLCSICGARISKILFAVCSSHR